MSRCITSLGRWAVSTDARRGLPVALGELARIPVQRVRSGETVAPKVALAYATLDATCDGLVCGC